MDRRRFVASAALGAVATAAALPRPAIAQTPPELQWRLASSFPKTLATLNGGVEYLCSRVAALTDNRFQIRPSGPGELAPPLAVLDAVQAGTVEMGHTSPAYYVDKDAAFGLAAAVPFGLTSRQQMAWLRHGGGLDLVNEVLAAYGCLGIPAGNTGAQMGGWYRKEIKAPDDFKGLKIGVSGLAGAVVSALGAVPQQIAGADIAAALEKGALDAAAWTGPYDDEKLGLGKSAKVYHYPGWWAGNETLWAFINMEKWRALPALYKAALEAACYDTCGWVQARYDAENPAALRRLVTAGAQLRPFTPELLQAASKATASVLADLAGKSPLFKKTYASWKPFHDEAYLWSGYADYRFESAIYAENAPPAAPEKAKP
jgi:TRAP-type mannitol/chloroaromatic compound transport system substrate-binding protein